MNAPQRFARIRTAFRKRPILSLAMLVAVLWIVVIRFYNVYKIDDQNARISSTIETFDDILSGKTAADIVLAHHFAVLSADVYDKPWEAAPSDCKYKDVLSEWKPLQLPDSVPTRPIDRGGKQAPWDDKLQYKVWYRENASSPRVDVALVFAGTNKLRDMGSNLRWVTNWLTPYWDQYDLVRTLAPYVEEHAEKAFPGKKPRVVATGHSLGGGLAQQAGYAGKDIKTVFAFDSSSVSGFYDVKKKIRNKTKVGMRVYRLNERGEILQYLRGIMSLIYPVAEKDPQIVQVTYNFDKGSSTEQHSIQKLACALIKANEVKKPS